ncbi:hypothetical protein GCM10011612_11410 [Actinomyces gaoshouyii]|uniref:Uncharacterized protein n=1 Tax=Actinomyces gaoshouyii TaxID=1960083 RepID=A0A8H9LLI5_9ACTO|nr:hypothetical protein GCM10011612_11410 [Actinomyces gaoshouyii]
MDAAVELGYGARALGPRGGPFLQLREKVLEACHGVRLVHAGAHPRTGLTGARGPQTGGWGSGPGSAVPGGPP